MGKRPSARIENADPGAGAVRVNPNQAGDGELRFLGGSLSDDFNNTLLHQAINAAWFGHSDEAGKAKLIQAAVGALQGLAPQDEIEGMLAAQMIATHNAAMECYRRAMIPSQPAAGVDIALTQANKLTRSYATLVQALDKHRGKGQQTVRVEHVHVHNGGQAIVGNVAHGMPSVGERATEQSVAAIGKAMDQPLADDLKEPIPFPAAVAAGGGGSGKR